MSPSLLSLLIVDNVLSKEILRDARADCSSLVADKKFVDSDQHDSDVRSDQIFFMREEGESILPWTRACHLGLLDVLRMLRSIAVQLQWHGALDEIPSESSSGHSTSSSQCWHGLSTSIHPHGHQSVTELGVPRCGQVARYTCTSRTLAGEEQCAAAAAASSAVVSSTGGARYTAHRDGLPLQSASAALLLLNPGVCMREVTAIVYLTDDNAWTCADGSTEDTALRVVSVAERESLRPGALVLYVGAEMDDTSGETATSVVEILPVGGRLVLFDSRAILHEVRPNTRPDLERLAVTVWIGGPTSLRGVCSMAAAWARQGLLGTLVS